MAGGKGGESTDAGNVPSGEASKGLASDTSIWSLKGEERTCMSLCQNVLLF